ncbi:MULTISPECIES: GntR family transcriptional regulator [unclassified Endozoicomonas]|uniref:GntR family transcriptional regulator n=1 Tax=unclassified Endozoicomonas TaxID=2644528 RepID=UPI002148E47B|nr:MULTISPECIES: GntR family transcriptional regulator [unclassified Endozoicomonas]
MTETLRNNDPVRVGTQAQEVAGLLIGDIISGRLSQGCRISEPELSRKYGVGRGPLREAILKLEGTGLVVRAPHVGATVVTLNQSDLSEIFAIREALEGMAARLAAIHMSDQQLLDLESLLKTHASHIHEQNGQSYIDQEGDLDFHYRVINGSCNQRLIRSLCDELYYLIQMYRKTSGRPARPEEALTEHQMIFRALKERDGELAEILMRRHIARARKEIEQCIDSGHQH